MLSSKELLVASFDESSRGEDVAAFVDRIKRAPEGGAEDLYRLLSERHQVYRNKSTNETIRIRAYVMAGFEMTGLPRKAIPYVLESLESSFHPFMVAAAAKALRGLINPHPQVAAYLIKAIYNISQADKPVSFESYHHEWPLKDYTTGLDEICETLTVFGAHARMAVPELKNLVIGFSESLSGEVVSKLKDTINVIESHKKHFPSDCCGPILNFEKLCERPEDEQWAKVEGDLIIEDQDGERLQWKDFFMSQPTVVVFFYTRCNNPRKCTQTIFNLRTIQKELVNAGLSGSVNLAALTYDPAYDTPGALKAYGDARGFEFNNNARMFRVPYDFTQLVKTFELGVNFTDSQVSTHRVELYVLDKNGSIVLSFLRLQSEPRDVVLALKSLLNSQSELSKYDTTREKSSHFPTRGKLGSALSLLLAVFIAFFPKCPVCWASYLSVFGVIGVDAVPFSPLFFPVICSVLILNLVFQWKGASNRNGILPVILSFIGSACIIQASPQINIAPWLLLPGFIFLFSGALLQAVSFSVYNKLKLFFLEAKYLP